MVSAEAYERKHSRKQASIEEATKKSMLAHAEFASTAGHRQNAPWEGSSEQRDGERADIPQPHTASAPVELLRWFPGGELDYDDDAGSSPL